MESTAGPGAIGTFAPDRRTFWIDGRWQYPRAGADAPFCTVTNPASTRTVGRVPVGSAEDVDDAVRAAREAFAQWATTTPAARGTLLSTVAAGIRGREDEFAAVITAEMGAPRDNALGVQTRLAAEVFESYAELLGTYAWEERIGTSQIVKEPAGVVAAITPWNYPLYLIAAKAAAALAAGCTIVLKPSQDAPLDAFLLAEIFAGACDATGAPGGVFNLLTGAGAVVGQALAEHPQVDVVSFTGSTAAGRKVAATAAATVKRVGLELGGKSACVVLADEPGGSEVGDLGKILSAALDDVFHNSGQTCTACTRILLPDVVYDEAVQLAAAEARRRRLGDPSSPGDHLGPIATAAQYDTVLSYIDRGVAEGARLVAGGKTEEADRPDGFGDGFWVSPTVFADVTSDMSIAQEEIFGPVVTLHRYHDEDEAAAIANDSVYGLGGAVWCADPVRAGSFARRIRTGRVRVNGGSFNVAAPTGGYKQSGIGRELGAHGLDEYLEIKTLQW
ncbi:aldehyde dehydrogenase family protein [Streptomyces sp. NPDC048479]|uniref:aldehyde dehydrogenase family protein n=1 Tax=Streptomyces sp. NPDC048479 TaxID=3154725 RepID=UPI0034302994